MVAKEAERDPVAGALVRKQARRHFFQVQSLVSLAMNAGVLDNARFIDDAAVLADDIREFV